MKHNLRRNSKGAVLVEFAVLLLFFVLVAVVSTDISMAILARTQVQNAARAGAEYAATRGYDVAAIKTTALGANVKPLTTYSNSDITISLECGCITTTNVILAPISDPLTCTPSSCTSPPAYSPSLFATVSIQGSYQPLIPYYWGSYLSASGNVVFTATVKIRTFNPS